MAFIKLILTLALACYVNSIPQVQRFDKEGGWEQTALIQSLTNVRDGTMKQVAFINVTVATWNYNQDSYQLVSDTVRRNLANIEVDSQVPHEMMNMYDGGDTKLPLMYTMTVTEIVSSQEPPHPLKRVGLQLFVDVWAKKKHRTDVLGALKNFSL